MSTIIFINGTSSSGKTSLVKTLQAKLQEPYLDMGADRFIWMLPGRYLDRPLWDDVLGKALHSGPVGLTLFSGMHHAIAAAASRGINILADHVFVEKAWVDECAELFADMNAYIIGLQCPLEVLEQREKDRKDRIRLGRRNFSMMSFTNTQNTTSNWTPPNLRRMNVLNKSSSG